MNSIGHLAEVMTAEAELTEQLIDVMHRQQAALVSSDAEALEKVTECQEELLLPIEGLEQERLRLTKEVWSESATTPDEANEPISLSTLLGCLPNEETGILSAAGSRLHSAVEQMVRLNQTNQYLIEHSRKFVRETLKIVVNGSAHQFVDQKI